MSATSIRGQQTTVDAASSLNVFFLGREGGRRDGEESKRSHEPQRMLAAAND